MSIVIAKPKDIKCPHCGNTWEFLGFTINLKDYLWVPNGHKCKMGDKVVEAVDPYPSKVTCDNCHKELEIEYSDKEKVTFT